MIAAGPIPPSTSSDRADDGSDEGAIRRAHADLYRYLAAGALAPPDEAAVLALREGGSSFLELIDDPALSTALAELERGGEPDPKVLSDEFHALFVVPGSRYCMPNESIHLDVRRTEDGRQKPGLLWGASTVAVRASYARMGYRLEEELGELPDHIAAELLFMARLYEDESDAWSAGDRSAVEHIAKARGELVRDHLGRFVPLLRARIEEATTHPYFRAWASLLGAVVAVELEAARTPARRS